ncbi:MAG: YjfB family protein [Betaproteobacteria bacterium]|nr:YjfB family protein [Betaproteobacteria bacterium]
MDASAIVSAATAMSEAKSGQAVQMAVLKKALDLQGQGAIQLVQAAVQTPASNPSHLGSQIDTFA